MRQHKYCMHSIKKIGACRKRKKKKQACQQVTSAPRDLLLQGTAAFIIRGSRAAARPPASPPRPAGSRAGEAGSAPGRAQGAAPAGGVAGGRLSLLLLGVRVGAFPLLPHAAFAESPQTGSGAGGVVMHAEGSGPGSGN